MMHRSIPDELHLLPSAEKIFATEPIPMRFGAARIELPGGVVVRLTRENERREIVVEDPKADHPIMVGALYGEGEGTVPTELFNLLWIVANGGEATATRYYRPPVIDGYEEVAIDYYEGPLEGIAILKVFLNHPADGSSYCPPRGSVDVTDDPAYSDWGLCQRDPREPKAR